MSVRRLLSGVGLAAVCVAGLGSSSSSARDGVATVRALRPVRSVCFADIEIRNLIVEPELVEYRPAVRSPLADAVVGVRAGATYRIATKFLGQEPGTVSLEIGDVVMDCQIAEWTPKHVAIVMPAVGIEQSPLGRLQVRRADGKLVKSFSVRLLSPALLTQVTPTGTIEPAPSPGTKLEATLSAIVTPETVEIQ